MSLYRMHDRPDDLRDPVLVLGLEGWIDAGFGAAAAIAALVDAIEPVPLASFDVDTLLDHRARRPVVRITDGVNVDLTWPELELRVGRDPNGSSVLVLAGPEPDHQWRAFTDATVELAEQLGVRLAVGLGAFPAPVPHTRPCRLAATATTSELARQVGFVPGTLDVPAGVQAALERRFAEAGLPAVGLWARVPHYVAAMPYPAATAALLDGLGSIAGLSLETTELHIAAAETSQKVDALIAGNAEHVQLVRQLEAQVDAELANSGGFTSLPSGDEIAAELERYLRDQR